MDGEIGLSAQQGQQLSHMHPLRGDRMIGQLWPTLRESTKFSEMKIKSK
jgi:hypothetical protein